jgi:WD40 repeat protein
MCKPLSALVRLVPVLVASLALAVLPSAAQEATDTRSAPLYREIMRWGETNRYRSHLHQWSQVKWSPDGKKIAALGWRSGEGARISIWDVETGHRLLLIKRVDAYGFDWSPDSTRLVTTPAVNSSEGIQIWDAKTGEVLDVWIRPTVRENQMFTSRVAWNPNGSLIATNGAELLLWNLSNRRVEALRKYGDGGTDLDWSSDGQQLVSYGVNYIDPGFSSVSVQVWGIEPPALRLSTWGFRPVAFQPGENRAAISTLRSINIISASNGTIETRLDTLPSVITLDWSPDGNYLAAANIRYAIHIWNTNTGRVEGMLNHDWYVNSLSWSPDGHRLASASSDGTIRIWGQ